jgi:hypothetical protein
MMAQAGCAQLPANRVADGHHPVSLLPIWRAGNEENQNGHPGSVAVLEADPPDGGNSLLEHSLFLYNGGMGTATNPAPSAADAARRLGRDRGIAMRWQTPLQPDDVAHGQGRDQLEVQPELGRIVCNHAGEVQ